MDNVVLKVEGMRCPMCEAHVCDYVRKTIPEAKGVKASHKKNEVVFEVPEGIDLEPAKKAIEEGGYHVLGEEKGAAKKGGLFHIFKK